MISFAATNHRGTGTSPSTTGVRFGSRIESGMVREKTPDSAWIFSPTGTVFGMRVSLPGSGESPAPSHPRRREMRPEGASTVSRPRPAERSLHRVDWRSSVPGRASPRGGRGRRRWRGRARRRRRSRSGPRRRRCEDDGGSVGHAGGFVAMRGGHAPCPSVAAADSRSTSRASGPGLGTARGPGEGPGRFHAPDPPGPGPGDFLPRIWAARGGEKHHRTPEESPGGRREGGPDAPFSAAGESSGRSSPGR